MQTGFPDPQSIFPPWQGFVGVHVKPLLQVVQLPIEQTMLSPHSFPSGALPD
jgi:hypothetical protein